jgi:hypothetical protein
MKRWLPIVLIIAAAACGGSTTPSALLALPQGQYILRILGSTSTCAATPDSQPGTPLTSAFALVTLSRSGSEWIARATPDAGDAEMRFRETRATQGGAFIEGSFRGTLANMAAAGGIASSDTRASFGTDGSTTLTGTALVGPFNTSIINGDIRGAVLFRDGTGRACTSTTANWALQFVQ